MGNIAVAKYAFSIYFICKIYSSVKKRLSTLPV